MPDCLVITGVPNARLTEDLKTMQLVASNGSLATISDMKRAWQEKAAPEKVVHPEQVWSIASKLPYQINITWSDTGGDYCHDVIFRKRNAGRRSKAEIPALPQKSVEPRPWNEYANSPLSGVREDLLVDRLRLFLEERLPKYMIPSAFEFLDAIPLTANGKVDRKALPAPVAVEMTDKSEEGRTAIEEIIAGIWSQVLRLEQVGIHQNFFELGGHSLLATQVVSRIREVLGVEVALRTLFEAPTVAGLAKAVERERSVGRQMEAPAIVAVSRDQELALSYAQQRLWFIQQLEPESAAYNIPSAVRLIGSINLALLRQSLGEIARRHEVLRTRFESRDGHPVQVIDEAVEMVLPICDISHLEASDAEQRAKEIARQEAVRPFDLERGPVWRARLVRMSRDEHLLVINQHHVASDGWSTDVMIREFTSLYKSYQEGHSSPLSELEVQYADFAVWQREWLSGEVLNQQLDYWKHQLAAVPVLELPTDHPRPAHRSHHGAEVGFLLSAELTHQLKALSRREGVTLFMTLLAAFQSLLSRYSAQHDVAIGTAIAGRNHSGIETLIGFFVNTLVLRTDLSANPTVERLLADVRQTTLEAYSNQEVPFEKVVEQMQPERSLSREPMFQVMLIHQQGARASSGAGSGGGLSNLRMRSEAVSTRTAKFDLTLSVGEQEGVLGGALEYATELYEKPRMSRLIGHLRRLLEGMVGDGRRRVKELPLLSEAEAQQVVVEWNDTSVWYSDAQSLPALFDSQAEKSAEAVAVVFQQQQLSYGELNRRANQLAHYLASKGVGPEVRVGICCERSIEMMVALLGIAKAGGAYVPLEPSYPQQRLATILREGEIGLVVLQGRLREALGETGAELVKIDDEWPQISKCASENAKARIDGENLAYVIYTSGSTGKPKGAMNTQAGIINRLLWMQEEYGLEGDDAVLQKTPYSFDVSVWELFWPLIVGAKLVMAEPEGHKDRGYLARVIEEEGITTLHFVPAMLEVFLEMEEGSVERLVSVRRVICSGEALSGELERKYYSRMEAGLHNLYGPTEAAVDVTAWACKRSNERGKVPIGRPIANLRMYIMEEEEEVAAVGVGGELRIGGVGVGRGYLNGADLTAERFVPNAIGEGEGSRVYRTGDVCRYGEEGEIEYVGRADQQVKVRGQRIELGEVEAVIMGKEGIRQCAVEVREEEGGKKGLVAYVVVAAEGEVSSEELRSHIREKLPEYMVPSWIVELSEMPLTPNGKVDRKALPAPTIGADSVESREPGTPVEEIVAGIFEEVLRREEVGVEENFFEMGGHSLLATQVVSRVREALQVELPLRAVFESPTVEGLAERVERERREDRQMEAPAIEAVSREREMPLSYAQQRLWFIQQLEPESAAYNIPLSVRLEGNVNMSALRQSLEEIARRHEVLRTRFETREGRPVQVIDESSEIDLAICDISHLEPSHTEHRAKEIAGQMGQRPFDLRRGPVWRAALVRVSPQDHLLLVNMHHVVSDGWSLEVMVGEFTALYESYREGKQSRLAELEVQYADFAVWQREWLSGEVLQQQVEYWKGQLAEVPVLEMATDRPRPAMTSYRGAAVGFKVTAELTGELKALSRREGVTLFMTLVAAFQTTLGRHAGQQDVVLGTDLANRNRLQTESLIGFFVNQLVLRTDLSKASSLRDLLKQVRETTLEAYAHQDVPFEKVVEELQPEREMNRSPLFDVKLVLGNARQEELRLGGVKLGGFGADYGVSKFDLTLLLTESKDRVAGTAEYASDIYDEASVRRLLGHLLLVLEAMSFDAQQRIGEISLLTAAEQQQVLVEWNDTVHGYGESQSIHELFERQTELAPDTLALICGEEQLSYRMLNERANRLAHYLGELGVGAEVRVALCLERGSKVVVALLAVLKAGGAYVPMDPSYPIERLAYMLEDSQAPVLLTQHSVSAKLPGTWVQCVELDREWEAINSYPCSNPVFDALNANPAYLIYTSGSTGKPKGVLISHRNLCDSTLARLSYYEEPVRRYLILSSFAFDSSVAGIFWPLVEGGAIVIPTEGAQRDPGDLVRIISNSEVSHLLALPSLYEQILETGTEAALASLSTVIIAGEECHKDILLLHQAMVPRCLLVNEYGPTEATVWSTAWTWRAEVLAERIPIGRAIENTRIYVVDERLEPVPAGVNGELYIGGDKLSQGYLNRMELTAERFVPDGLSGESGARLYRTGDLVRWRGDGELDFLGRVDHQVKLRGYRIELGEIESMLLQQGAVKQCAVILREDEAGDKRIVGYVVGSGEGKATGAELREYLRGRLPDYMVPSWIVELSEMPLTPNGKVDRKALPAPTIGADSVESREPGTALEEIVAGIFEEVLRVERVGIQDNFFELGGHSLLATQVVSRIREVLSVEVALRALFEAPTVAGLAEEVERERNEGRRVEAPAIEAVSRERELPLSYAQQRLWFIQQLEPESAAYNIPLSVRLQGEMNQTALRQSLEEIARRHEVLRTRFETREGRPVQVIDESGEIDLAICDISHLEPSHTEHRAKEIAGQMGQRPFDLRRGPVWRAALVRVSPQDHLLLVNMHHVVSDGWSLEVMVGEFTTLYESYGEGKQSRLAELEVQYADFAVWQRNWLTGEVLQQQVEYWKGQLAEVPVLEMATDRPRPAMTSYRGAAVGFKVTAELTGELKALSRREGVTLFMTLVAAFDLLLSRYSGQEDISVGSPIANRNRKETEALIGFFTNTVVLRVSVREGMFFNQLVSAVRDTALESFAYQDLPFEKLVEELQPDRSLSHSPLFQVMFSLNQTRRQTGPNKRPAGNVQKESGLRMSHFSQEWITAKFDLNLGMSEADDRIVGDLEYSAELFDRTTAERMVSNYLSLLQRIARAPEESIRSLAILSEAERQQLVIEWNETTSGDGVYGCVSELFNRQAERTPHSIAAVFEDQQLSYQELNRRANQLGHHLQRLGAGPEVTVGISMERSLEMAVGLLGIVKTGAAYLPLDITYPAERLTFMLEDGEAAILLTQQSLIEKLPCNQAKVVCLDGDWRALEAESADEVESGVVAENQGYLIYTSGSTGIPKGVSLPQRALRNLIEWHRETMLGGVKVLQFASLSFDASFHEVFAAWATGGAIVLIPEELRFDVAALSDYIREKEIEKVILPVVVLQQMAEMRAEKKNGLRVIREMTTTGEQLQVTTPIVELFGELKDCRLHNHYGPSESHVVTAYSLSREPQFWARHPAIGAPIYNTQIYLLDGQMDAVPMGAHGELYIGGVSLARGYCGRPELTAEKFVPDPLCTEPGGRLYRTGDLCRYQTDGKIEYGGRIDHQVKVRGFRIELGEIEAELGRHPSVKENVVMVREDEPGRKQLVAYVVTDEMRAVSSDALRRHLSEKLPDYMVPAAYVLMESLPLTGNGKINRRALPRPEMKRDDEENPGSRNAVEEILCGIWAEVLKLKQVGVRENFFELGGHSLLATQVISRARESLQVEIQLRALFERPTVEGLAEAVERERGAGRQMDAPAIVAVSRDRELPLSHAQQRLWFIQQLEGVSWKYNVSEAVRMNGRLNPEALEKSISEIVRRHEVLRTSFPMSGSKPIQTIAPAELLKLPIVDLQPMPVSDASTEAERLVRQESQRPFDLAQGSLMRVILIRLNQDEHIVFITMHHIISDAWSVGVFVRELAATYKAFDAGEPSPLPDLPIQYADYAVAQREWLEGERVEELLNYWKPKLTGAPRGLRLRTDRPPTSQASQGACHTVLLSSDILDALKALSRQEGVTLYMTLLAAFNTLLYRCTQQDDIVIGTPIAGRNRVETESLIGLFLNTLALRTDLSGNPSFRQLLKRVREVVLGAYDHQEMPFDRLMAELPTIRDRNQSSLIQVGFDLHNVPVPALQLPDLALTAMKTETVVAKADFILVMMESPAGLVGLFEYNPALFDEATIIGMAEHFQALIESVIANPDKRLLMLPPPAGPVTDSYESRNLETDEFAEIFKRSNLTVMQVLFWLGQKLQPDSPLYNEIGVCIIPCRIDPVRFKQAFQALVNSCDALRTVICEEEGIPQQRVLERLDYSVEFADLSLAADPEAEMEALIEQRSRVVFDFERCLFDIVLIKVFEDKFACFMNNHNIIVDGLSGFLIYQRLFELYDRALKDKLEGATDLPAFKDYVTHERQFRGSPRYLKDEAYWAKKLADDPEPILYYGKPPQRNSAESKRVTYHLSADRMEKLNALVAQKEIFVGTEDLSLLGVFATLLFAYLYRVSGQSHFSIGVTYHNRVSRNFQEVIGLLMQALPLRVEIQPRETFASLNKKVVTELLNGFKHASFCIRDPNKHKKNHAVLNYVNSPIPRFNGVPTRVEWGHSGYQNEPLALQIHRLDHFGKLSFELDFNLEIFDEEQRAQAVAHFCQVLDALLEDVDCPLDRPDLLWVETQKQRLSFLESEVDFDFSMREI